MNIDRREVLRHKSNVWECSSDVINEFVRRAKGIAPELTSAGQIAEILAPMVLGERNSGKASGPATLLDAGCGTGHLFYSFDSRQVPVKFTGIDVSRRFIAIARRHVAPKHIAAPVFQVRDILQINGTFDYVVCLNTLCFLPNYHIYLERLCQATDRVLVVRCSLDESARITYPVDGWLDAEYNYKKLYFNTYALQEVRDFIAEYGFEVTQVRDAFTQDGEEVVAGKPMYRKILVCRRQSA